MIVGSFLLNFLLCGALGLLRKESDDLPERHISGDSESKKKIAVVRIDGVLMEGMTQFAVKQIEQCAKDEHIKAIVLRIDSPGGTITAAEDLHRLLMQLRDGKMRQFPDAKPKKLIVSMGAVAASGGYYIAMPGEKIFADKTCLTGSIGVYASLPNVAGFIHQHGVKFELIKAGAIKASGSPFQEMTPQERQPWQEMVDAAYDQFLDTVVAGRAQAQPPLTKANLRDDILFRQKIPLRDDKGNIITDWFGRPRLVEYTRYRADGGSFTAAQAKKYGLIDDIGDLDAAIDAAAASAQLAKYDVITFERPPTLLNSLLGVGAKQSGGVLDPQRLANGASPRLWYLMPHANFAGVLTAMGKD